MKKLNLYSLLGLFVCLFTFSGCSSDDDDNVSSDDIKNNIVGLWETTHISGYTYDDTEDEKIISVDKDLPLEEKERILFRGDGTYKYYYYLETLGTWYGGSYSCKYEVSGNKIILYDSKGDIDGTFSVTSIKGDKAVIEYTLEEGPQYVCHTSLTKIEE